MDEPVPPLAMATIPETLPAVVEVVAVVAKSARATCKLGTKVVEVTVNGAVPVATVDTKVEPV